MNEQKIKINNAIAGAIVFTPIADLNGIGKDRFNDLILQLAEDKKGGAKGLKMLCRNNPLRYGVLFKSLRTMLKSDTARTAILELTNNSCLRAPYRPVIDQHKAAAVAYKMVLAHQDPSFITKLRVQKDCAPFSALKLVLN